MCKVHVRNIPHTLSTLSLIYFLEGHIGTGSVALCEPCHQSRGKGNHRDSAFVHFHTLQGANRAIRLSKQGVFRCSGSKISIFPSEKECDRRKRLRKISCKKLKNCKVHMGCLVKENIFHSLRCYSNCVIEVEKRSKIFRIIVIGEGHSHIIHKLEWRFRDIHEVKWCKVPDGSRCFMLRVTFLLSLLWVSVLEKWTMKGKIVVSFIVWTMRTIRAFVFENDSIIREG